MSSIIKLPHVMYMDMAASEVCNMHCKHCHIWMNKGGNNAVSFHRRVSLISEFARLNGKEVFFTGGEVTKDIDELVYILSTCKSHGLASGFATNGSYITNRNIARQILEQDVDRIILSIDSHDINTHDWVRGKGSYSSVTNAMKFLIEVKKELKASTNLIFQQVLFKENLPMLPDFIEFSREFGVDHVDWQILNKTYNNQGSHDPFFEKYFWHTEQEVVNAKNMIADVIFKYNDDPFVMKKLSDLHYIHDYIQHPNETQSMMCDSVEKNVIVNYKGLVSLCFSDPGCYPYIGNINADSLMAVLNSTHADLVRSRMMGCKKGCGIQECHRTQKKNLKVLQ